MAQQTAVKLTDDIDGGQAEETVEFGLDGVDYQIDLSEDHAQQLRDVLDEFIKHARRIGKRGKRSGATQARSRHRRTVRQNQHIREWARKNGYPDLPDRGRLPAAVVAAYDAHRAA